MSGRESLLMSVRQRALQRHGKRVNKLISKTQFLYFDFLLLSYLPALKTAEIG